MASADEAMALCDEILALLNDVPEAGEDFAASVEENVLSIQEWVETKGFATDAQMDALQNMLAGAERWCS